MNIKQIPQYLQNEHISYDIKSLNELYKEQISSVPMLFDIGITPVIICPKWIDNSSSSLNSASSSSSNGVTSEIEKIINSNEENNKIFNLKSFKPEFVITNIPLMECSKEELKWLPLNDSPGLQLYYNPSVSSKNSSATLEEKEIWELLESAYQQPLSKEKQDQLLEAINENNNIIQICSTNTDSGRISQLVDNNPEIASSIMLHLVQSNCYTEYLNALINMEVSFKSMQVMSTLVANVELPSEYIDMFTSHCIASCTSIEDKGKQTRLVRLVSVFLQNLIIANHFKNEQILLELQSFCINFSKIKEAVALFKIVKEKMPKPEK